jgi:hypothetical protein
VCPYVIKQVKGDFMKRISRLLTACCITGVALVAVATAQRPGDKPPEGLSGGATLGQTELVAVSQAGDAVLAYSAYTGRWHKQAIPPGQEKVPYTVGSGMVSMRLGKVLYGFSSEKGTWDSIEVGEDVAGPPALAFNMAYLKAGSKIYVFSRMTGNWSMVDLSKP